MSKLQVTSYKEIFGTLGETKQAFERFVVEVKPVRSEYYYDFRVHKLVTDKTVASANLKYEVWFCTSVTEASVGFYIDDDADDHICSILLPMTDREQVRKALDKGALLSLTIDGELERTIRIISDLDLFRCDAEKRASLKELIDSGNFKAKRGCSYVLEFPEVKIH